MLQCLRSTGHLPCFLVPTLGDLTAQESPPPGIGHPRQKNANARESARGALGSWNWLMHYRCYSGCLWLDVFTGFVTHWETSRDFVQLVAWRKLYALRGRASFVAWLLSEWPVGLLKLLKRWEILTFSYSSANRICLSKQTGKQQDPPSEKEPNLCSTMIA